VKVINPSTILIFPTLHQAKLFFTTGCWYNTNTTLQAHLAFKTQKFPNKAQKKLGYDPVLPCRIQSLTCRSVLRQAVLRLDSGKHEAVSQSCQTADCSQVTGGMLRQSAHLTHDVLNCQKWHKLNDVWALQKCLNISFSSSFEYQTTFQSHLFIWTDTTKHFLSH